ncbi:hypothetical protein RhiirA4_461645 [Rhizophagus irregularis]|uniref:Crinkler effector protein N-terminal domain-containing protein n=1 Tax=Rhizophagus irregularis TaxID=588596 RepID=A0A2I1GJA9_9GLOM|nr:hypothetical protein RhiirA4_461645 [Rhizophagus irregularis]
MKLSINCLLLGKTSFDDTFVVNIADKNAVNVNIKDLKISDLKFLIWNKKKDMLEINDPDIMTFWKVDIAYDDKDKLKHITSEDTDDNIKKKLGGMKLIPIISFKNENIHVIVQVPATDYPNKRPRLIDYDDVIFNINQLPTRLLNTVIYMIKQPHQSFLWLLVPDVCGKSRNATEISRILREKLADDLDLRPNLKDAIIQYSQSPWKMVQKKMNPRYEPDAIAKRMFYQCQDGNLIWNEVHDLIPSFTITEILKKCAKYKRMSFKRI